MSVSTPTRPAAPPNQGRIRLQLRRDRDGRHRWYLFNESHPIVRSAEPGEDWSWCFLDQVGFVIEPRGAASSNVRGEARP